MQTLSLFVGKHTSRKHWGQLVASLHGKPNPANTGKFSEEKEVSETHVTLAHP